MQKCDSNEFFFIAQTTTKRLVELINHYNRAMTVAEIAVIYYRLDGYALAQTTARIYLAQLVRGGLLQRVGRGTYAPLGWVRTPPPALDDCLKGLFRNHSIVHTLSSAWSAISHIHPTWEGEVKACLHRLAREGHLVITTKRNKVFYGLASGAKEHLPPIAVAPAPQKVYPPPTGPRPGTPEWDAYIVLLDARIEAEAESKKVAPKTSTRPPMGHGTADWSPYQTRTEGDVGGKVVGKEAKKAKREPPVSPGGGSGRGFSSSI